MKILFLTLNTFSSLDDRGIYTDLMREFINNNHDLYIVTPVEKRKKEPTTLIKEKNATILKIQTGNIQKTNILEKGISTLTLESKFKTGIKKYFSDVKFDLVLYSTPPITFAKVVQYIKNRDDAKSYLLLKDIFPQNAVDLGMFSKISPINAYFRIKEKKLYEISDVIGCMSEANREFILKNNDINSQKVEINPNTIEPITIRISDKEKYELREKYHIPQDKTIFIYGGNLGKPQGIDFLIECIKKNEGNENSFIVVVGSGTEFPKIDKFFAENEINNSVLLKQLPKQDYEMLANSCDVGLIFLDHRFTIPNFPSRLLSYMQASMPVLAATDSNTDIGKVITDGEFGYWCESNDVAAFNELVNKLIDPEVLLEKGQNARNYLEENYTVERSYNQIMTHFQ